MATTPPKISSASPAAGDVVELGDDQRLLCPIQVRDIVKWLTRGTAGTVYADLCDGEYVRLWPQDLIEPLLQARMAEFAADPEHEDDLKALFARYRPIGKQPDARVRLTEAVLLHLGVRLGERPYLYVQASIQSQAIDVMSLEFWKAWQQRGAARTVLL